MKKTLSILTAGILAFSCTNRDIEFDDYEYQSIYFPFQSPVRTIILGDESVGDNAIDLEHAFSIGVTMGGVYENNKDRVVEVALAPELAENIRNADGDTLEILPAEYYTADFSQVVIPKGSFVGKIRVDLNDIFFEDPLSTSTHYVIPVRITDAGEDTVLSGVPIPIDTVAENDPRIPDHWEIQPQDYTIFGVKYINETHGMYLLRGARTNTATDSVTSYSARFLTSNSMTRLSTVSLTENVMNIVGGTNKGGTYQMRLTFNNANKTVTVSQLDTTTVAVNGSGVYFSQDDAESEGYNGIKHRTVYLDYTYFDPADSTSYNAKDSLVFADTDVTFEDFDVIVFEP